VKYKHKNQDISDVMKNKTDLVVGAFVIYNDKLLLIRHAKLDKWLPPGGHIEENETYDEAVMREVKEETGLDVEFVGANRTGLAEEELKCMAIPFYANVHSVGDHYHACLFYLCRPKHNRVVISHESKGHRWVTREELEKSDEIPGDVKKIGKMAFDTLPIS